MTPRIRPRRSVLYVPGSNARAMEKARSLPCDCVILDLEDGVAPEMKEAARKAVCEAVKAKTYGAREVIVRVNAFETQWSHDDFAAAAQAGPDAVLVPKIDDADEVQLAGALLAQGGAPLSTFVWAMMETPFAILQARAIAGASGRLAGLVIGANDLVKYMGARMVAGREPLLAALSLCVTAARAFGLSAIDGVYNPIGDAEGFAREARQGRDFGFDGKTVIHPDQIETANRIFAPDADEVAQARKILAAFARPENSGKGAIMVDGHMVELLHAENARRTLALAEAIGGYPALSER